MIAEQTVLLTAGEARALIRPACGATVDELSLMPGGGGAPVALLAGQEPSDSLEPCEAGLFRGRLLGPFSDRIPSGSYYHEGRRYQLERNDRESGDAIHGFLYRTSLDVRQRDPGELHLGGRIEGVEGYPFILGVSVHYFLEARRFSLSFSVRNVGGGDAPVTLGWHPYFTLPGTTNVDDLKLTLPARRLVTVDEGLIPTGELSDVEGGTLDFRSGRRIGAQVLDVGLELEGSHAYLSDGERRLSMSFGPTVRYVQLFTPPDRASIAIEPLTAATNAFNQPELGLQLLSPEEELTLECSLSLE